MHVPEHIAAARINAPNKVDGLRGNRDAACSPATKQLKNSDGNGDAYGDGIFATSRASRNFEPPSANHCVALNFTGQISARSGLFSLFTPDVNPYRHTIMSINHYADKSLRPHVHIFRSLRIARNDNRVPVHSTLIN